MLSAKAALLSVIIPVYNVEPYLEECLNSVINQTYKNLEIICINDGSTDNSLKILEKFAKKDSRIKLINQKNQGAAVARNTGLDIATGEYITFVDSDDYLELNAYEEVMKVMLNDQILDFVEFRERAFDLEHNDVNKGRVTRITNWFGNNFNANRHNVVIWNKIFKFNLIRKFNIRFLEHIIHDDNFFSAACELCSKKSSFLNLRLYNYRIRTNSISDCQINMKQNKAMDLYYNYAILVDFAKKNNIYKNKKDFIYGRYIEQILKFCNDKNRLLEAAIHWDKKILNSDCPYDIKEKYMQKRDAIEYVLSHPFEFKIYELMKKVEGRLHIYYEHSSIITS